MSKRYAYIDAMRGYAILLVIAVHSSQYFDDLPEVVRALADQGARGVQLFFVASAITLCMSWQSRHDGAIPFYVRRFFRIAPMFYLAIPFFLWARGFGPNIYAPDGIGWRHITMAATFTHGLMPDTITSVVPGSWSIADEMMFYLVFPLLMPVFGRIRFAPAVLAVIAATLVCLVIRQRAGSYVFQIVDPAWRSTWATYINLWFLLQLPCFLFGMLAFKWMADQRAVRWPRALVLISLIAMVVLAFFPMLTTAGLATLPIDYAAVFALFAVGLAHWQPRFLVNPIIGWIGKVSFSGYLVHLGIIAALPIPHATYVEAFLGLTALTIAISSMTYFLIEEPFNRLGRRLARRLTEAGSRQVSANELDPVSGVEEIAQQIAVRER